MNTIKILIAEDHTIVRKGLCSILKNEKDIDVIGEAENGKEAIKKVEELTPDIVVMDISMPLLNGLEATLQIKKRFELVSAIHAISQGNSFLSPSVSKSVINKFLQVAGAEAGLEKSSLLTEREREVLQLIAEGHSTRKIAELLFISVKTVEAHRSHIMEKLDLHNIADLTRYAIRTGIISSER